MKFTIDLDCFLYDDDALSELVTHTTNAKLIDAIAKNSIDNSRIISDVINNQCTSATTINMLANSSDSDIREWVAEDYRVYPKTLAYLADDIEFSVRCCVAASLKTPIKTLSILANDEDETVRYHVASNPNTSLSTLVKLAVDEDEDTRETVINNSKITIDILNILLGDSLPEIRKKAFEKREELLTSQ